MIIKINIVSHFKTFSLQLTINGLQITIFRLTLLRKMENKILIINYVLYFCCVMITCGHVPYPGNAKV